VRDREMVLEVSALPVRKPKFKTGTPNGTPKFSLQLTGLLFYHRHGS